eukprot:353843-Chlamydomonas_euryale.AAC.5
MRAASTSARGPASPAAQLTARLSVRMAAMSMTSLPSSSPQIVLAILSLFWGPTPYSLGMTASASVLASACTCGQHRARKARALEANPHDHSTMIRLGHVCPTHARAENPHAHAHTGLMYLG